jgi:Tripartite tricarboxylate transporter family receptor
MQSMPSMVTVPAVGLSSPTAVSRGLHKHVAGGADALLQRAIILHQCVRRPQRRAGVDRVACVVDVVLAVSRVGRRIQLGWLRPGRILHLLGFSTRPGGGNIDHAKRTGIMRSMTRFLFMPAVIVGPWIFGERAAAQSFPNRSKRLPLARRKTSLCVRSPRQPPKDLGQPVVVDNKPGAAATLAAANLLAAKPDGYTIATGLSTLVLLPQMQKVAFEPMQDFT